MSMVFAEAETLPARYGEPGPRHGGEFREGCDRLRYEARELRGRLDAEGNPYERGRLEGRLHELRERLERCRY